MALARVVTFDGVDQDRVAQLRSQIQGGEPPEGLNAKEIVLLHDPEAEKSLVIVFFDSEDDYRQGDEKLRQMSPPDEGFGQRGGVEKYEVAVDVRAE